MAPKTVYVVLALDRFLPTSAAWERQEDAEEQMKRLEKAYPSCNLRIQEITVYGRRN